MTFWKIIGPRFVCHYSDIHPDKAIAARIAESLGGEWLHVNSNGIVFSGTGVHPSDIEKSIQVVKTFLI